nr:MBL fold metallo-hydrolase [Eubacterium sp.]
SRNSTSEAMLDVLQPELALVSAPKKSFYGHPHQETLDRLQAAGAEILMTKDSGAVSLTGRNGGFRIEQYNASQKE